LTSDSEDDGSFPRGGTKETTTLSSDSPSPRYVVSEAIYRKDKKDAKDKRDRQFDITSTVPRGIAVQAHLDALQENQKDSQRAPAAKQPLHVYMESASESDPEPPSAQSVNQKEPFASVELDQGSSTGTPHKKKKAAREKRRRGDDRFPREFGQILKEFQVLTEVADREKRSTGDERFP
jgi:hypothetical protein